MSSTQSSVIPTSLLVQENNSTLEVRSILDGITTPDDLKKLDLQELSDLCSELRTELIETVSEIGGHFASSLGVVELTVGVHRVYNTPYDRVIWDTGHQAYIHKMLTGRRRELHRIRKAEGISGFLKRSESEYDAFGAGHASTSISAAAGMCEAAYHEHLANPELERRRVVAIIGDAAIANGMAFEALNHLGQLQRPLTVILNDNEMSIAPSVGALSLALSKAVTGRKSTQLRKHLLALVQKGVLPHALYRLFDKAEEAAQGFFATASMLFSSLGFRYIGPIDGHNLQQVLDALERAKEQNGPVLVHALTEKGHGYEPAERNPIKYHGVTPFRPSCGTFIKPITSSKESFTTVFGKALVEFAQADRRVVGITAGMPDGTGLCLLAEQLPERYFDVGIAEEHAVTFAAGLACEGMKPVVAIYSTFMQRAFDQILHDVCIQELPVILALDRGGLVGADGATHHGVFDLSYLRMIPNLTIMAPKDECELRNMLHTAISECKGAVAIRYPRAEVLGVPTPTTPVAIPLGRGEIVHNNPAPVVDIALIAIGITVQSALSAATILERDHSLTCRVINARFAKPLDSDLIIDTARHAKHIITIEDNVIAGGFGSAVIELLNDAGQLNSPITRLGVADHFVEHGTQDQLYHQCGYDTASIITRALAS